MNKKISAFPIRQNDYNMYSEELPKWSGMTLRDYFANSAMQGIMIGQDYKGHKTAEQVAIGAYKIADAMLKQREL